MLDLRLMVLIPPEGAVSLAAAAIAGGATVIQFRAKDLTSGPWLAEARSLNALCTREGVPLIINDRMDIALAAGAAGVHLGPEDLPVKDARRVLEPRGLVLGASARTPERARELQGAGAGYLGVGALRASPTKPGAQAVGLDGIAAVRRAVALPLVAIGGIRADDAASLKRVGVQGMAVHGGVVGAADVTAAARAYRAAWDTA